MATETITTGPEIPVSGEAINRLAKERVAKRQGTLAEVQGEISKATEDLMNGNVQPVEMEKITVDTNAPLGTDFELDTSELESKAKTEASQEHQADVREANGRTATRLTHEADNVLGHSDGVDAWVDVDDGLNESTVEHEWQHVRDGDFIKALDNPDESLATGMTQNGDADLEKFTGRAILEKRATVTGGRASEQYQADYVDPYDAITSRMESAGVNARASIDRLIGSQDFEGFRKDIAQMLMHESTQNYQMN